MRLEGIDEEQKVGSWKMETAFENVGPIERLFSMWAWINPHKRILYLPAFQFSTKSDFKRHNTTVRQ